MREKTKSKGEKEMLKASKANINWIFITVSFLLCLVAVFVICPRLQLLLFFSLYLFDSCSLFFSPFASSASSSSSVSWNSSWFVVFERNIFIYTLSKCSLEHTRVYNLNIVQNTSRLGRCHRSHHCSAHSLLSITAINLFFRYAMSLWS